MRMFNVNSKENSIRYAIASNQKESTRLFYLCSIFIFILYIYNLSSIILYIYICSLLYMFFLSVFFLYIYIILIVFFFSLSIFFLLYFFMYNWYIFFCYEATRKKESCHKFQCNFSFWSGISFLIISLKRLFNLFTPS